MRRHMKGFLIALAAAAVLCGCGGAGSQKTESQAAAQTTAAPQEKEQGKEAPKETGAEASGTQMHEMDFTVKLNNGTDFTLSEHLGKTVFVNFWATWCGPCCMEMPDLDVLAAQYADNPDVEIVAVNCGDKKSVVDAFSSYPNGYTKLPIGYDEKDEVSMKYNVQAIPMTVIFAPDGSVYQTYVGVNEKPGKICPFYAGEIEAAGKQ